jgi:response regulator NasT
MPAPNNLAAPLRIAVVADISAAASEISRALRQLGHIISWALLDCPTACARAQRTAPQAVLLRAGPRNTERALEYASATAGDAAPLVLLTPIGSPASADLARRAGALVHLVEPTSTQALLAALHVAIARAGELRHLRAELVRAREAGHVRLVVERAKAILMRRLDLTEEAAHRRLQTESRSRNRTLTETSWHVIRADSSLAADRAGQL